MVYDELKRRGVRVNKNLITNEFFDRAERKYENPFPNHHTKRYLKQCFYNLQEKYDRGQKDFTLEVYMEIERVAK